MSFSVVFHGAQDGGDGPFQLASASGWSLVSDWVDRAIGPYPTLRKFLHDGQVQNTAALSHEMKVAMSSFPPADDVRDTLKELLDNLGVGDAEEWATVTNGEGSDE